MIGSRHSDTAFRCHQVIPVKDTSPQNEVGLAAAEELQKLEGKAALAGNAQHQSCSFIQLFPKKISWLRCEIFLCQPRFVLMEFRCGTEMLVGVAVQLCNSFMQLLQFMPQVEELVTGVLQGLAGVGPKTIEQLDGIGRNLQSTVR